ncbi:hypothetical protein TSUD_381150 [Trifolium subterraneum]|uniref:Uncharacterized protein n=1 Tax=Trifolium subterraneum TaxID=3900 RepID=A0A2Z6MGH1_TRISU|nr:hypothetical protein TSUD_381150 [Trifolium subterraneum]
MAYGLWPSNMIQSHPRDCVINPSSFDFGKIQNLSAQLSIDWPDLKGSKKKFWKAQWDKHGSCSQFKQSYYFEYAMYLRARDSLTSILEVEGITPGGSYYKQAITDAIVKKIGVDPWLTCVLNNTLAEIHLCFNPTIASYENCPSSHHQTCKTATVLFEA